MISLLAKPEKNATSFLWSESIPNLQISLELLKVLQELQEVVMGNHDATVSSSALPSSSAYDFLRHLESRLNERMHGIQHDAGEIIGIITSEVSIEVYQAYVSTLRKPNMLHDAVGCLLQPSERTHKGKIAVGPDGAFQEWRALQLPWKGLTETHMQCLACRHMYTTHLDPFNVLEIPLPSFHDAVMGVDRIPDGTFLTDLLNRLHQRTAVEGVSCPKCSIIATLSDLSVDEDACGDDLREHVGVVRRLGSLGEHGEMWFRRLLARRGLGDDKWKARKSVAMRWTTVSKWPAVLILHLCRCGWGSEGTPTKIVGHVQFPLRLEVEPRLGTPYELVAVIRHVGLASEGGHYVTFRRIPRSSQSAGPCDVERQHLWCRVSDESVQYEEDASQVMSTEASVLIYELGKRY